LERDQKEIDYRKKRISKWNEEFKKRKELVEK